LGNSGPVYDNGSHQGKEYAEDTADIVLKYYC
jgi:hypothetical protein